MTFGPKPDDSSRFSAAVPIHSGWRQGRDSDPWIERGWVTITKHEAAERLVDSFSAIPTEWVKIITHSPLYGIMWGTVFIVNHPVDKERIQALLHRVTDEE